MPGGACIVESLHMTIQTAVLIDNLKVIRSDLRWCSCKILYNQDHTVDLIMDNEFSAVFSWKGESLKEYWNCILNAFIYLEDYGKINITDLIVDYGGDMTIIIHEGNRADDFSLKDGTINEPIPTDNIEFKMVQTIIKRQL